MSEEIRIYAADLAAYNAGILHGRWIDATQEPIEIQAQIQSMLDESPIEYSEEFAIHDYEGFGSFGLSEYTGIQEVYELACFIQEFPETATELLNHYGGELEFARKAAEDAYSGCYKSLADYAQELTESCQDIPENLEFYIDYDRMGRDMELSGDIFTIETGFEEVHIFWSW